MASNCTEDRCAHYIANDKFHIYRHKFLWTIILATILAGRCFAYITYSFKQTHASIANTHEISINKLQELLEPAKMSKDSCYYADKHLVNSIEAYMTTSKELLELQSTKIQSDYAILSLWAGILMIVFLVFSIYSMFETDEMLRTCSRMVVMRDRKVVGELSGEDLTQNKIMSTIAGGKK